MNWARFKKSLKHNNMWKHDGISKLSVSSLATTSNYYLRSHGLLRLLNFSHETVNLQISFLFLNKNSWPMATHLVKEYCMIVLLTSTHSLGSGEWLNSLILQSFPKGGSVGRVWRYSQLDFCVNHGLSITNTMFEHMVFIVHKCTCYQATLGQSGGLVVIPSEVLMSWTFWWREGQIITWWWIGSGRGPCDIFNSHSGRPAGGRHWWGSIPGCAWPGWRSTNPNWGICRQWKEHFEDLLILAGMSSIEESLA